jgi:hypothetical protein
LGGRWVGLAVRAHLRGAIDYRVEPRLGWGFQEQLVFGTLEKELLAELERLIFQQHVAIASTSYGAPFTEELDHARSAFTKHGRLTLPWLQWGPEKTLADLWEERCARHKDPAYRAAIQQLQTDLDTDAQKIARAVEEELQLRQQAAEHLQKLAADAKKPIGRRHVRGPRRKRGRVKR